MDFTNIIRQIAKQNGVTPEEVEEDMKEAFRIGMSSPDPITLAHWEQLCSINKEPSVNDVLNYILNMIQ